MNTTLDHLRADESAWHLVSYSPGKSEERGTFDLNEQSRLEVILAMQYDRRESDLKLLRHLFIHEIIARENDDFQGIGTALTLAAFLLARFRDPADIPLFYRAKFANFDTGCGFSAEYMYVALREKTPAFLAENLPEISGRLTEHLEDLAAPLVNLDAWWLATQEAYPDTEEAEDLMVRYRRSLELQDEPRARQLLDEWRAQEGDSDSKWSHLRFEYARLGDFQEAVCCELKRSHEGLDSWDRSSRLSDLIELHRLAGDYDSALGATRQLDEVFAGFDRWVGLGLGRIAIHKAFELAETHPDLESARRAFQIADSWYQRSHDLALVGREAAVRAAVRCGLNDQQTCYESLATAERARISLQLARFKAN